MGKKRASIFGTNSIPQIRKNILLLMEYIYIYIYIYLCSRITGQETALSSTKLN